MLACFWRALYRLLLIGSIGIGTLIVVLLGMPPSVWRDWSVGIVHLLTDVGLFSVMGIYVTERIRGVQ